MSLDAFARKLQKDGAGRVGASIFVNHAVEKTESGILLRDDTDPIDYELPKYHKFKFQGIVWSKDYKKGRDLADKMSKSLTIESVTLENMDIKYVRPRNRPISYPLSGASVYEFLVIFEAVYVIV